MHGLIIFHIALKNELWEVKPYKLRDFQKIG